MKCSHLIFLTILMITNTKIITRQLFNSTIYNDACVNINYTSIFTEYFGSLTNQFTNLISSTNNLTLWDSNNSSQIIIDYIITEDVNKIGQYFSTTLLQFAIFILFAVIVAIGWLVAWVCCICPYCCCKKKEKDQCFKTFSFYIVIITCVISIITSIVSITLILYIFLI
jgi:hypothetical protein